MEKAKTSGDWTSVHDFYLTTFNSFLELNAAFKKDANAPFNTIEDSGINTKYLNAVYDSLLSTPPDTQKAVLKGIINSLLREWKGEDMEKAKTSGDWTSVHDFYLTTFNSFLELNAAFKKDANAPFNTIEDSGINTKYLNAVYDFLLSTSVKADRREVKKGIAVTEARCYNGLSQRRFKQLVDRLLQFISLRLFPAKSEELPPMGKCTWWNPSATKVLALLTKSEELPPMGKCTWWNPSATKVLALLNAANIISNPPIIPFTDFYNLTLDHIDIMEEYNTWHSYGNSHRFSFCQFPFILSIAAKKTITQRDSEQQMISIARQSLVDKVSRRQRPDMTLLFLNIKQSLVDKVSRRQRPDMTLLFLNIKQSLVDKVSRRQRPDMTLLFLNIKVRRMHLVSDSLDELTRKRADLKKKLKVTFVGEAGLDMGGLTKEWFLLLIRQIFHADYGMFAYQMDSHCHWFSSLKCDNYSEFRLVGTLMGLAVYNGITLDIRFPRCCYKKLLSPPIVPCDQSTPVGIAAVSLDDLQLVMPELAHGLNELLAYEGNVEEDFCSTFQVFQEEFGILKSYNLKPGGDRIPVTNQNRQEYVQLYVDFLLNKSMYNQFAAFYYGFHSVCASNALMLLRPEEVEILVCGCPELDMHALQKVTQYERYTKTDPIIRLPISHTCFNQLCLPLYKSKKELKQKLTIAISNAEGFGME
ncbi:UNVERIFIED_CONTAM: hypothetical protein FKN15_013844 [Acipenser sinensis]